MSFFGSRRALLTPRAQPSGSGGSGDPFWSSVVLLAGNDNAANGTTTFLDQSASAHTLTRNGNVVYTNSTAPTGLSSSISFPGASGDFLSSLNHADWKFGTGDYTVEMYVRYTAAQGTNSYHIMAQCADAAGWGSPGWTFNTQSGTLKPQLYPSPSSIGALTINVWSHIAVTRAAGTVALWIAGSPDGSGAVATDHQPTQALGIGGNTSLYFLVGQMAAIRITKGVARYTGAFTPPSLPLPTSA